jgi:soluble cytochrome b562
MKALVGKNNIPTPVEIAISALKMALKIKNHSHPKSVANLPSQKESKTYHHPMKIFVIDQ